LNVQCTFHGTLYNHLKLEQSANVFWNKGLKKFVYLSNFFVWFGWNSPLLRLLKGWFSIIMHQLSTNKIPYHTKYCRKFTPMIWILLLETFFSKWWFKGANIFFIFMCVFEYYWFLVEHFNYLDKTLPRLNWHLSESLNNCSTKSSAESWKEHWFCRFEVGFMTKV